MLLAQARRGYIGHSSEAKPRNTFRGRTAGKWVTPAKIRSHRWKMGHTEIFRTLWVGVTHFPAMCPKYFGVTNFPAMRPLKVLRGLVSEL